jgi:hypothetical protein
MPDVFRFVFGKNDNQLTKLTGDALVCIEMFTSEKRFLKEMPKSSSSCDCKQARKGEKNFKMRLKNATMKTFFRE